MTSLNSTSYDLLDNDWAPMSWRYTRGRALFPAILAGNYNNHRVDDVKNDVLVWLLLAVNYQVAEIYNVRFDHHGPGDDSP